MQQNVDLNTTNAFGSWSDDEEYDEVIEAALAQAEATRKRPSSPEGMESSFPAAKQFKHTTPSAVHQQQVNVGFPAHVTFTPYTCQFGAPKQQHFPPTIHQAVHALGASGSAQYPRPPLRHVSNFQQLPSAASGINEAARNTSMLYGTQGWSCHAESSVTSSEARCKEVQRPHIDDILQTGRNAGSLIAGQQTHTPSDYPTVGFQRVGRPALPPSVPDGAQQKTEKQTGSHHSQGTSADVQQTQVRTFAPAATIACGARTDAPGSNMPEVLNTNIRTGTINHTPVQQQLINRVEIQPPDRPIALPNQFSGPHTNREAFHAHNSKVCDSHSNAQSRRPAGASGCTPVAVAAPKHTASAPFMSQTLDQPQSHAAAAPCPPSSKSTCEARPPTTVPTNPPRKTRILPASLQPSCTPASLHSNYTDSKQGQARSVLSQPSNRTGNNRNQSIQCSSTIPHVPPAFCNEPQSTEDAACRYGTTASAGICIMGTSMSVAAAVHVHHQQSHLAGQEVVWQSAVSACTKEVGSYSSLPATSSVDTAHPAGQRSHLPTAHVDANMCSGGSTDIAPHKIHSATPPHAEAAAAVAVAAASPTSPGVAYPTLLGCGVAWDASPHRTRQPTTDTAAQPSTYQEQTNSALQEPASTSGSTLDAAPATPTSTDPTQIPTLGVSGVLWHDKNQSSVPGSYFPLQNTSSTPGYTLPVDGEAVPRQTRGLGGSSHAPLGFRGVFPYHYADKADVKMDKGNSGQPPVRASSGFVKEDDQVKLSVLNLPGVIRYADTAFEVEWLVKQLRESQPDVLGFDIEWRCMYKKHEAPRKVALIQLAYKYQPATKKHISCHVNQGKDKPSGSLTSHDTAAGDFIKTLGSTCVEGSLIAKQATSVSMTAVCTASASASNVAAAAMTGPVGGVASCGGGGGGGGQRHEGMEVVVLLLQVYYFKHLPQGLVSLLEDPAVVKAGVGITGDGMKLHNDWGVTLAGSVELGPLANTRVLHHRELITTDVTTTKWSLAGLVRTLLHHDLPKERSIRCGNWEAQPLSQAQQRYAALDAYAGLTLYHNLMALPLRAEIEDQAALNRTAPPMPQHLATSGQHEVLEGVDDGRAACERPAEDSGSARGMLHVGGLACDDGKGCPPGTVHLP